MPDPFVPYPDSIPPAALQMVWDSFRGGPVNTQEAIHAAYHCAGFALGKTFPHTMQAAPPASPSEIDEAFAAAIAQAKQSPHTMQAGSIPWAMILQVALEILQKFLAK